MQQAIRQVAVLVTSVSPATLKWPAAVLVALCFGLVLFGLVQYQAFNRLWGLHLVFGLAGGATVAGLGASFHWFLGVLYGLGYLLTWLVWVLTRRWRWWRRALARGLAAALALGPWLWLGATERGMLVLENESDMAEWLLVPNGLIWFWMTLGALWLLVLVGGWGCWRWPLPAPRLRQQTGLALPSRRCCVVAAWAVLGVLGLNWYAAGRVDVFVACEKGQYWRLGYVLVSRPGSHWDRDADGSTPLHSAAEFGPAEAVRLLIAAGADVHAKASEGGTPLHSAALGGNAEVIRLLLATGADVNARDKIGGTPLHWAAVRGKTDALRLLLATGADVNAKANNGATSLHGAAAYGRAEVLRLLLGAGARVNARKDDGGTPLREAAANGNVEALRLLLDVGADVHAKDNHGWTPLHLAAGNCNVEALRPLLGAGARVNERDVVGRTALDLAGDDECRDVLRQAGGKTGFELDAEKAKPAQEPVKPEPER